MKFALDKSISNHYAVAHGGIYSAGLKLDPKVIDFSSNVNPLGFPPSIKKVIKKNLSILSAYPDSDSLQLRYELQKYTGISKDQITIGNGATEIIYNFCKAFLRKNNKVLIPIPTFGEYEAATRLSGAKVLFLKTMNLNENISEAEDMLAKVNCLFICNPNNPTGIIMPRNRLLKIVEKAFDKSVFVFLDECFIEMVPKSNESIINHVNEFDNLFILRSLTKSFGLAGLRIGYGLGNKKIIDVIQRIKIPWNINALAQEVAIEALSNKSHLDKTKKLIKSELKFLTNCISEINGFTCYNSSANFILIKMKMDSKKIQKKLIEKQILIRDCSTFRGLDNKFIRIAVRSRKENIKLVNALKEI